MEVYLFERRNAMKYGVSEAILISLLQNIISHNRMSKLHHHQGRTWCCDSVRELVIFLPFWSKSKISRTLRKLVDEDVLRKDNFNDHKCNRTIWYAFSDEITFLR